MFLKNQHACSRVDLLLADNLLEPRGLVTLLTDGELNFYLCQPTALFYFVPGHHNQGRASRVHVDRLVRERHYGFRETTERIYSRRAEDLRPCAVLRQRS